jgi:hypothetical protein
MPVVFFVDGPAGSNGANISIAVMHFLSLPWLTFQKEKKMFFEEKVIHLRAAPSGD